MTSDRTLESILKRDRAITLAGLATLTVLAWTYLVRLSREVTGMAAMGVARMEPWTPADVALTTVMWAVMMTAMMLPAAAPMILVFATVNRKRREAGGAAYLSIGLFVTGYLAMWASFSVAAALLQWGLRSAALLSDQAVAVTPLAGSTLLAVAGVYQLTPLKYACLARCQTPVGFLLAEWRDGRRGALLMGVRHGLFCLGCCWVLMSLLFVGGAMNLVWVAALSAFVLVEKIIPAGRVVSWASGVALIAWAVWTLQSA